MGEPTWALPSGHPVRAVAKEPLHATGAVDSPVYRLPWESTAACGQQLRSGDRRCRTWPLRLLRRFTA
jgi:hypothetical protein